MTGFEADPAALEALARTLEDTAEEYGTAADETGASGDLGPVVSDVLRALTGEWADRIRAVRADLDATAASVRTAAAVYRTGDANAVDQLRRTDG
ncbi:type VII secretion target [Amycolatopsis sp. CA-128772]|uniref:type VII secretion target n=1 Tax=Amycolatopsis sp. CA-128772 TaxID=2073159 RepID=UPI000CD193D3|nr:type VII secretion target [Amycolatopsis sp. CA-128772]